MSTYTEPPRINGRTSDEPEAVEFEQAPQPEGDRQNRVWKDWMMICVGLTALVSIMALIIGIVALASKNPSTGGSVQQGSAATPPASSVAAPLVKPQALTIAVKSDDEHGRRGPDGKWHDAFLPADFSVRAGATVKITMVNYDGGPHSFTSPALGVNQIISGGGSLGVPQKVTFTFKAPKTPGKYAWWCAVPCDPWAMSHDGYMRGFVTVKA